MPLKFYQGKLIDGRNRVRAAVISGIDTRKLPRQNLPDDIDPYQYAWDLNCARLDYAPQQKAAIRIKIMKASGELAKIKAEIEEEANQSRMEKTAVQHKVSKPWKGQHLDGGTSRDVPPSKIPSPRLARTIADSANVSTSTAQRALKLERDNPEAFELLASGKAEAKRAVRAEQHKPMRRRIAKNWSVPRAIPSLAAFLRQRLTSTERRHLVRWRRAPVSSIGERPHPIAFALLAPFIMR